MDNFVVWACTSLTNSFEYSLTNQGKSQQCSPCYPILKPSPTLTERIRSPAGRDREPSPTLTEPVRSPAGRDREPRQTLTEPVRSSAGRDREPRRLVSRASLQRAERLCHARSVAGAGSGRRRAAVAAAAGQLVLSGPAGSHGRGQNGTHRPVHELRVHQRLRPRARWVPHVTRGWDCSRRAQPARGVPGRRGASY